MTPVTYMTKTRGVKSFLTRACCILLCLWDLQWVRNLVHDTWLTPIILRRLPNFFFLFLKLGLTHPAPYVHIYTAKQMIQSLKQFCIEECRWVLCWHSKQENTSGNDNSNNPNQQWEHQTKKHNYYCIVASLRHDQTFNRVSQISLSAALFIQHVKHKYRIILSYVACLAPHFPTLFPKQHNFQKHVNKHKMRVDFLYRKLSHANGQTDWN